MEKAERQKHAPPGSLICRVKGNQLIFREEAEEGKFHPRLHYVIDFKKYLWPNRKARSIEYKKPRYRVPEEDEKDESPAVAHNVVLEFDETKKEEDKHPPPSHIQLQSKSTRRWTLLRSVVKAVALFRRNEVQLINNSVPLFRSL